MMPQKIKTFLWYDNSAEQAAEFYCSLFKDSRIHSVTRYPEGGPAQAGTAMTVEFSLAGVQFVALNGGPVFKFTEAVSLTVDCEDQAEVDVLWSKLTADGGSPPSRRATRPQKTSTTNDGETSCQRKHNALPAGF